MSAKLLRRLAAAFLITAGLMAIWTVTNQYGTDCGSWISLNTGAAGVADAEHASDQAQRDLDDALMRSGGDWNARGPIPVHTDNPNAQVDSCRENRDARTGPLIGIAVLGFALLGFAATRPTPPTPPSAAS